MRISDWSSDVCSSDLRQASSSKPIEVVSYIDPTKSSKPTFRLRSTRNFNTSIRFGEAHGLWCPHSDYLVRSTRPQFRPPFGLSRRSEEHMSELQSLMRLSYAVFCLKKKQDTLILKSTTKPHYIQTYKRHI